MLDTAPAMTVAEIAARFRVGCDRVRAWIRAGELAGINTSDHGTRPRFVATIEAVTEFEKRRSAAVVVPLKSPRRKRRQPVKDWFSD